LKLKILIKEILKMNEKNETTAARIESLPHKIRWSRIIIGCLLGISFAVALGFLRYFNAIDAKDMGIAIGLSIAEFVICVAIAIFVEHRRLARLRWRVQAVEFERRQRSVAEAERWKNEVQTDLSQTEAEVRKFRTDVDLRTLRANSIEELKKVARKAVLDGYNSGKAIVRNTEITGESK
jgi:hypothetical protein